MKWFEGGLTKEQLNTEYRKLAKEYHPDLHPDDAENCTRIMAEINDEYDKYYTTASYNETGYNADDIRNRYNKARKEREIILAFLKKDKQRGEGFFTFNNEGKIVTDGSSSWNNFRGGFALCRLTKTVDVDDYGNKYKDQEISKIPARIEFPNYAEMYFGLQYGEFARDSIALANSAEMGLPGKASMNPKIMYHHIRTKMYGDIWLSDESFVVGNWYSAKILSRKYAYMKVGNQIMRCGFDLRPEYYEVIESVRGKDFGYIAFQDCTKSKFMEWYDVDYSSPFADAMDILLCKPDDLYWINDPIVEHFARRGIVTFYRSKVNHRLHYGTFNEYGLDTRIHELSIKDAEHIQDYLDELNGSFDNAVKGMIKKGKVRLNTMSITASNPRIIY